MWKVLKKSQILKIKKVYCFLIAFLVLLVFSVGLAVALAVVLSFHEAYDNPCKPDQNKLRNENHYFHGAVSSDAGLCANIANNVMMIKGGNAVDAAISGGICNCAVHFHSCGIGGGSFIVIYIKKDQKVYTVDLREEAPSSAYEAMFTNNSKAAIYGGKAIAVMGLVSGYYEIHRKLGHLPWEQLFQPTIELLNTGFYVSKSLERSIKYFNKIANKTQFSELWSIISNKITKKPKKFGNKIKIPKLSETLKIIAKEPYAMKNGSLVDKIIQEIKEAGGNITRADLAKYTPKWRSPVAIKLKNDATLYTLPPPSSGALVGFIINIMEKFSFDNYLNSCEKTGLFFHRLIETMKFAFAKRSSLGDMDFVNISNILLNLTSDNYAKWIKSLITDDRTHDPYYYYPHFKMQESFGTAHFSLISPEGDAVSETSTINFLLGSFVMGSKTGILYNNEMDDFSIPNHPNIYNLKPSPYNFIKPQKRPMSSMSPIIIVSKTGEVSLVVGASGGSRIISTTALVSVLTTILNLGLKESIDYPRIHHQLFPNEVVIEKNFPEGIIKELKKRGHKIRQDGYLAAVQGIRRNKADLTFYECYADYRKMGRCDGY